MIPVDENKTHILLAELKRQYGDNPDALDTLDNLGKNPTPAELNFTKDVFEYWY